MAKSKILFTAEKVKPGMSLSTLMDIIFGKDTKSSKAAVKIWNSLADIGGKMSASLFSQTASSSKFPSSTWYDTANKMDRMGILDYNKKAEEWALKPKPFFDSLHNISSSLREIYRRKLGEII